MLNFRKVGLLTIIGGVLLLLNTLYYVLQVSYFGISRDIENYFVALGLCTLALSLTAVGHFGQMALPLYLECKETYNKAIAEEIFSVILNRMFLFSLLITCVLYLLAPFLIQCFVPGFAPKDYLRIESLLSWMLLSIPLQVINVLMANLLNAERVYGRLELAAVLRVSISIALLVILFESLGVYVLVISYLLESILFIFVNVYLLHSLGFGYRLGLHSKHFQGGVFFKEGSVAYWRNGSRELFLFALTASLSYLPEGILAIYKYIQAIFQKVAALVMRPMQMVFFTRMAEGYARQSTGQKSLLRQALNFCFLYALVVVVYSYSFGEDILQILWSEHYQNRYKNIAYAFLVLQMISLVPFAIEQFFFKTALVYKQVRAIYFALGVAYILSAIYCYGVVKYYGVGGLESVIIMTPTILAISTVVVLYRHDHNILQIFEANYFFRLGIIILIAQVAGHFINVLIPYMDIGFSRRVNILFSFGIKSVCLACVFLLEMFLVMPEVLSRAGVGDSLCSSNGHR